MPTIAELIKIKVLLDQFSNLIFILHYMCQLIKLNFVYASEIHQYVS